MKGPEATILIEPQAAVAYLAPKIQEASDALQMEGFFTPEGYNVLDPEDAEGYLRFINPTRDLPMVRGEFDASTGFHLARALQRENRAAIYDDEGNHHQNVAEHSFNLAVTVSWVAMAERTEDIDAGKAAMMATFHDLVVEAYGGDTPIHDEEALATKDFREAAGMTLFLRDAGDSPLGQMMKEYEEGRTTVARFVKGMDKVEAYQLSLDTKAALHRMRGESYLDIVKNALPKAAIDGTAFEKMKGVLKEMGRKWHEWGCQPFEGDADKIVERLAGYVRDQGGDIIQMPLEKQMESAPTEIRQLGELVRLPPKEVVIQQRREVDTALLRQLGVPIIGKLVENDRPTPPTSPPTPAAFALAAA